MSEMRVDAGVGPAGDAFAGAGVGPAGDGVAAVAAFEGRLAKVQGAVRTGKTEALVRRAATLLARGVDPASILMTATTAEGARVLRGRLAGALRREDAEELAGAVRVTTVAQECLRVLDGERARAATGRIPRLLAPFEYNFFLEDMKVLGSPVRRLRAQLERFQRQWAALPAQEDWVDPGEDAEVMAHALAVLRRLGSMLPEELAYVCARYLASEAGAPDARRYAHVLADDFQNLTHAEQTCVALLASEQLIVAGNPNEAVRAGTRFPDAQAFADFENLRRDVAVFTLNRAFGNPDVTAFCDALCTAPGMDDALVASEREGVIRDVATIKWNLPDEEFNGLTRYLLALCEEGAAQPGRTAVVVPNKQWARAFEQMLAQRGFAVSSLGFGALTGDPRDLGRARALRACTALNLLADPADATAWRLWTGYGNYLCRSDGWAALASYADERGIGVIEALDAASRAATDGQPEPFLRAGVLAQAYDEGRAFIEANASKRGFALMAAVGAQGLPAFSVVNEALVGDEDAAAVFGLVRERELFPTCADGDHAVTVTSYEMTAGCDYDLVLAAGCVDGFMPVRDAFEVVSTDEARRALLDAERRAFMAACGKAGTSLALSTFSKADLELAELTKMQVTRIRAEDDRRVATVRPTCYIAEAGAAAPLTIGGQALLSELGAD